MGTDFGETSEQQEAISEIDCNLQIIACAGSAKAEVITRWIANILQSKPKRDDMSQNDYERNRHP